ncbi:MAG: 3-deoxy-7-phosphoheptulonate synthase [Actinomycetota bacterium]|nr:3-deoxy-7-phosphoheptulonate synthase [Actinomycetota bacterium]
MIVILRQDPDKVQLDSLITWLKGKGMDVHESRGTSQLVLGLVGDTTQIDIDLISALDIVEDVKRVQEPYKKANRKFHPEDTVIPVGDTQVGGGNLTIIAGPCSVESREQLLTIARLVKEAGATMLRGGAFKPRTSPYSFQGLGPEGLDILREAREETGLPIVTEIMDAADLPYFEDIDVLQVGARNMQNFDLLKAIGQTGQPVLLKRGMSATYQELLMSAEYIMSEGNEKVILCERGIRTFESYTRNTFDVSAVPVLRKLSHLPIVVDPSHAGGKRELVAPLALAGVAAGADGLEIEVHHDPARALSDGPQALLPDAFTKLVKQMNAMHDLVEEL